MNIEQQQQQQQQNSTWNSKRLTARGSADHMVMLCAPRRSLFVSHPFYMRRNLNWPHNNHIAFAFAFAHWIWRLWLPFFIWFGWCRWLAWCVWLMRTIVFSAAAVLVCSHLLSPSLAISFSKLLMNYSHRNAYRQWGHSLMLFRAHAVSTICSLCGPANKCPKMGANASVIAQVSSE